MKMPNIFPIKTVIFALVTALALGGGIWWWRTSRSEQDDISVRGASNIDIRTLVQLCTTEIYEDVPVKYRIGTKHLVARQLQQGTVSFDLEGLDVDTSADTLTVVLPAEIVEIHESTAPNAYEVYDTWNDELFGSNNLTVKEENKIKASARRDAVRRQYANGTVARARKEAAGSLKSYMEMLYRKPVVVVDPAPAGVRYKEYVRK